MIKFKYPVDYKKVESVLVTMINDLKVKNKTLDKTNLKKIEDWISKAKTPENILAGDVFLANQDDINQYLVNDGILEIDMSREYTNG